MVVAATLAFAALGAMWSVLAPLGEAPDEPAHLALVLHLAEGKPYPSYDGLHNQNAIIRLCRTYAAATRACPREGEVVTPTSTRRHGADEAPNRATRPAWDDAGGDTDLGQLNQMPQHPPLYYQAMAQVLRLERALNGGPWSTDRELALLRLANVALIAPLPLLAWWAARRFGLDDATGATAAVALLAMPMVTHIGSTLNNDNLLTLLAAILAALLAGVSRGDRTLRTALVVGLVAGLALLTKAFAIVFPPLIVVTYLIGARDLAPAGWGSRLRTLVRPVAAVAGLVALVAGWWYVGVRIRTGRFAPTVEDDRLTAALAPPGFSPRLGTFASEFARDLNGRFWGSFGWYTVRIPGWQALLCTVVVIAAVVVALAPRVGAGASTRLQRAWLLAPLGALGAFVALRAWSLYATTSKFQFIQGRYLFAGLVGLVVLLAIGMARALGRWAPIALLAAAAVLQVDAARRALEGWWGGPGVGPGGQVRAMAAWGAWPGGLLLLLGVLATGAGLWLVVELVCLVARRGPEPADGGPVGSLDP